MSFAWKNALVAIRVPVKPRKGDPHARPIVVSTAYPIARDLLITVWHGLNPQLLLPDPRELDPTRPMVVQWVGIEGEFGNKIEVAADELEETIRWHDADLDVAVLDCPFPERAPQFAPLTSVRPIEVVPYEAAGFARAEIIISLDRVGSWSGKLFSVFDKRDYQEASVEVPPEDMLDWQGASGMPLVANNEVFGFLKAFPRQYGGRRLEYTPAYRLFESPAFRQLSISLQGKGEDAPPLISCEQPLPAFSVAAEEIVQSLRHQYSGHEIVVRELLQNSIDAKSEHLLCEMQYDDGRLTFRFHDDGYGMTRQAVDEKYLTLFAGKKTESDIGQFGVGRIGIFLFDVIEARVYTIPQEETCAATEIVLNHNMSGKAYPVPSGLINML